MRISGSDLNLKTLTANVKINFKYYFCIEIHKYTFTFALLSTNDITLDLFGFLINKLVDGICRYILIRNNSRWLLYDDVDPFGQLQWFENVMFEAEKNAEIVHILSHMPNGDPTCYTPWARQFKRIVLRYRNSIAAMFNGHTHLSQMEIYFDPDTAKPTNVAWNGGALTSYIDYNPNYRIYEVDSQNYVSTYLSST